MLGLKGCRRFNVAFNGFSIKYGFRRNKKKSYAGTDLVLKLYRVYRSLKILHLNVISVPTVYTNTVFELEEYSRLNQG